MDRRLIEAAQMGNVELLFILLKEDPLMLHSVALTGVENPLHIASTVGKLNFVQEMVKLRREFAWELNQDGFSPLHIAAANGYLEIVKEILKVDLDLCRLTGRGRSIPLHYAATKGRVGVMKELLAASPDSVEVVTARGETALHLAVKNNQFEGVRVLMEHLKQFKKAMALNMADDQGNTVLHLAVSRKQYEVVDLLLSEHFIPNSVVEVNSLNKNGLTAVDILQIFQSEAGDREIEEILRRAGAVSARDLTTSSTQALFGSNSNVACALSSNGSPTKQLLEYFKFDRVRDSPSEVRNTLLVIAILITTATYQAVLSPPGGVWQDDANSHTAGQTVMGLKNATGYGLFLLFNSVGFFASLHMIYILTSGFPLQFELRVSIFALIGTYDSSMTAITRDSKLSQFFFIISLVAPILIPIVATVVRHYTEKPGCAQAISRVLARIF